MSYSLVEIFQRAGKKVRDIDSLTGLAEYRNGGLFIDLQILELKKEHEKEAYLPSDPQIIEWRALTIALLDRLWQDSLSKFSLSQSQWPIAMLLEGASWPSGRKIARELRGPKAPPPLKLILEGNVF